VQDSLLGLFGAKARRFVEHERFAETMAPMRSVQ
jgi:hypothetical protein